MNPHIYISWKEAARLSICVPCKYCSAEVGQKCRTSSRKRAQFPHDIRTRRIIWPREPMDRPTIITEEPDIRDLL